MGDAQDRADAFLDNQSKGRERGLKRIARIISPTAVGAREAIIALADELKDREDIMRILVDRLGEDLRATIRDLSLMLRNKDLYDELMKERAEEEFENVSPEPEDEIDTIRTM